VTGPNSQGPTVLYVVGAGRSGSTILDLALGSMPGFFGLGEMVRVLDHRYRKQDRCSCGHPPADCPFWAEVFARAGRIAPNWNPQAYWTLLRAGPIRYAHLPWLMQLMTRRAELKLMREHYKALIQAAAQVSGARVLIDSSKLASAGRLATTVPGLDTRLLHLVRDGRGVLVSRAKAFKKDVDAGVERDMRGHGALRSILAWGNANLGAEWLRMTTRGRPSARLRYEDFCKDPESAWGIAASALALDEQVGRDYSALSGPVGGVHQIAGNRVRMGGPQHIGFDTAWYNKIRPGQLLLFHTLGSPWARRYGYGSLGALREVVP